MLRLEKERIICKRKWSIFVGGWSKEEIYTRQTDWGFSSDAVVSFVVRSRDGISDDVLGMSDSEDVIPVVEEKVLGTSASTDVVPAAEVLTPEEIRNLAADEDRALSAERKQERAPPAVTEVLDGVWEQHFTDEGAMHYSNMITGSMVWEC